MLGRAIASLLAVFALSGGGFARADGTPADDAPSLDDEVIAAWKSGDKAKLVELAAGAVDASWAIADDLSGRGEREASEAFAAALPEGKSSALLSHLIATRAKTEPLGARAALRAGSQDADAKRWRSVVELLSSPEAAASEGSILAVRLDGIRGAALEALKKRPEAIAAYARGGAAAKAMGWNPAAKSYYRSAAGIAYQAYLLDSARDLLDRLRDVHAAEGDALGIAHADHDLAAVAHALGDSPRASRLLRETLGVYDQLGEAVHAAETVSELGSLADSIGDFTAARAFFRQVEERLAALREAGTEVPTGMLAEYAMRLGVLAWDMGDNSEARERLTEAIEKSREAGDEDIEGEALGNMGLVDMAEEKGKEAIEHVDRARELFEKIEDPQQLANALLLMAHVHLDIALRLRRIASEPGVAAAARASGEQRATEFLADAMLRIRVALQKNEELALPGQIANGRGSLGEILLAQGKAAEALKEFEFSRDEADRLHLSALFVEELGWAAKAQFALGRFDAAAEQARRAAREESRLPGSGQHEYRSRARANLADVYEIGAMASSRLSRADDVAYFLEAGRAGSFARAMGGRGTLTRAAVPEAVAARVAAASRAKLAAFTAYQTARRSGLREAGARWKEYEALREAESRAIAGEDAAALEASARIEPPRIESPEDIRRRLEPGDVFVLYGLFPEEAVAVVVEKDVAKPRLVKISAPKGSGEGVTPAAALRGLAKRVATDGAEGSADAAAINSLREALFDSLALPASTRRVLVSPDGELSYLPFALLVPREWSVAYEPSGTLLNFIRDDERKAGHGVLALGDPAYDTASVEPAALASRGGALFQRIPASKGEVEAIAAAKDDVRLLGGAATEAGLRSALATHPRWRSVHLACHGLVDVERPAFSCLALTPGSGDDGLLTAAEVFRLRIPAEIAVLSACQTGRGAYVRGEGIFGLARAFMYAGAPRVLVSLWDVDDAATKELMTEFYRRWSPGTTGAAKALRDAQEHVRMYEKTEPDGRKTTPWAHPRFWAAWVLWGLPS